MGLRTFTPQIVYSFIFCNPHTHIPIMNCKYTIHPNNCNLKETPLTREHNRSSFKSDTPDIDLSSAWRPLIKTNANGHLTLKPFTIRPDPIH